MGIKPTEQACESKKVRVRRQPVCVCGPVKARRSAQKQEGMLWQRKMRSLATRRTQHRTRRDRSGAPMKRG